ncbi:type I-E CRISPR-associated protein Cas6/Cse3/CasE [Longispora sp. NPDC051575]|uniref:type I-E CRISPR-associated protein Cas6/Cse3/CasE n=1 Tax=Longispora sp. NPDC051575 TaxID=3154943 RepID=UPI00343EDB91
MKAWLTRLVPDPRSRSVASEIRDAVRLHKRVMTLVPDGLGDKARQQTGVLYRVDNDAILVQTGLPPDTSTLPAGYQDRRVSDLTALLDALRPGLFVRYRLAGNAVRRLGRNTTAGRPGQALSLKGHEAATWWAERAERCGLGLHTLDSVPETTMTGKRDEETRVLHAVTRYDGLAVITDPEALRNAITTGVGRGKSYGCGLLSIAPARRPT